MGCSGILERVDRIYSIIEQVEKHVGRLAEASREYREFRGDIYSIYTLLVRLRDELIELRRATLEGCKCEG
jgi:hypothetical protein